MEVAIIIDILRRAKANVVVASVEHKLEIVESRNVKLEADMLLDEAAKLSYDLIVLHAQCLHIFFKNLGEFAEKANRIKQILWSNLCMEPHGLLNGQKAAAFPAMCSKLSDQSEVENRVVVDGNLITSRGPGTSIEFAF
ncbi:hypothetical protein VNO78_16396 [Psophocarpus tetragonolobus]|uniref:DJ-1/PfpI domain-containing protein n=1 Tax=Psophocarpus tetragonolobus TaxID=3891 RepID=A0AAN9SGM5_PSOTE